MSTPLTVYEHQMGEMPMSLGNTELMRQCNHLSEEGWEVFHLMSMTKRRSPEEPPEAFWVIFTRRKKMNLVLPNGALTRGGMG